MFIARNLISTFAAAAIASSAAVALSPNAAADPAPPAPVPAQQIPGMPGLPALTELSPIIQQAAGNPEQATQLLMAAAQAFSHNPSAQWLELREMATAMEQGKYRSIYQFVVQYQRSVATSRAPVAAEKNTRTAAGGWREFSATSSQPVIPSEVEESLTVLKYREMSRLRST